MQVKVIGLILSILLVFFITIWFCCGKDFYYDYQPLSLKKQDRYKQLIQQYKKSCDVWEYNNVYYPFVKREIQSLDEESKSLNPMYDAPKKEKRYKKKVKQALKSFKRIEKYLSKIYQFQKKNQTSLIGFKKATNKDYDELEDIVWNCILSTYEEYSLPTLIEDNKKVKDRLELVRFSLIDLRLSDELDIKRAKRGYELVFDYMYKKYSYYLDEIEDELNDYSDFLYAFGFDRVKELENLKKILTKKYLDDKDKYWQKRYFEKIDELKSSDRYHKHRQFFKITDKKIFNYQKLLFSAYLSKYPVEIMTKELPEKINEMAKDFTLFSAPFISHFGETIKLGFDDGILIYFGHQFMWEDDIGSKRIKNENYYIENSIMNEFEMTIYGKKTTYIKKD